MDPKQSSDGGDGAQPRRSHRSNIGVPPARYGAPISHGNQPNAASTPIMPPGLSNLPGSYNQQIDDDEQSNASRVSSKSVLAEEIAKVKKSMQSSLQQVQQQKEKLEILMRVRDGEELSSDDDTQDYEESVDGAAGDEELEAAKGSGRGENFDDPDGAAGGNYDDADGAAGDFKNADGAAGDFEDADGAAGGDVNEEEANVHRRSNLEDNPDPWAFMSTIQGNGGQYQPTPKNRTTKPAVKQPAQEPPQPKPRTYIPTPRMQPQGPRQLQMRPIHQPQIHQPQPIYQHQPKPAYQQQQPNNQPQPTYQRQPKSTYQHQPQPTNQHQSRPIHQGQPRPTYQAQPQPLAGVDALANALTQALQFQYQNTERFVARQSPSSRLPPFGGNPLDWPLFIHHYNQSTAECGFSASQNMARLEKALKGEARATVQPLMIIPSNADAVITRLERRYGRPEYIVRALTDIVKKTAPPKEGKLVSIIDFSNAVSNLVATVKSLQTPAYLNNPQLLQDLVEKLPDSMKLQWGTRAYFGGTNDLEGFERWISQMAEAASLVTVPKFNLKDGRREERMYTVEDDDDEAVNSIATKTTKKCFLCDEDHPIYNCEKFKKKSLEQKWNHVKENNLCFRCLGKGHGLRNCRSKVSCRKEGCNKRHHTLLHEEPPAKKEDVKPGSDQKDAETVNVMITKRRPSSILRMVVLRIAGPNENFVVNALLDEGSTCSLISAELATKLGLKGIPDPVRIRWTDGTIQEDNESCRVDFWAEPYGENDKLKLKSLRTVKTLTLPKQRSDFRQIVKEYPHLQKQKMFYLPDQRPEILIGQPHIRFTIPREVIEAGEDAPIMSRCILGWALHGPRLEGGGEEASFSCFHESDDDIIHQLVKESFTIESLGITPMSTGRSKEDILAEEKMKTVTKRVGERWETGLLWRKEPVKLPKSYDVAYRRLLSIERKLSKNEDLRSQYNSKIMHYTEKGYARRLEPAELETRSDNEWYLPHFDTRHPNKPGKIRIVFDAASRACGVSLNDYLFTGPDLLKSLPGVLLQFREKKIAFSGDITEMFHQVRIRKEDCPAQRFLYRNAETGEVEVYQLEVMMFGSVCSPFCAQYTKNSNAIEFKEEFPAAVSAILDKHYMDDYLQSVDTEDEAVRLIKDVTEVHRRGGFEIGKWISNSNEVLHRIRQQEGNSSKNLSEWSSIPTERTLGLHWIPQLDVFTFRVNISRAGAGIATGEVSPTKRAVLRLLMLVWDPLGFVSHYLIKGKILLQDLWKFKVGWDDELPVAVENKWKLWIEDLPKLANVKEPRCYSIHASTSSDVQLHIFADSSELAACAVGYLRVLELDRSVSVSLVMSKTRVSPVKPCSIPRLELQAALIASRMGKTILSHLEINVHRVVYWTDSMTVLRWIRSEARRFQQFVAHRVGEIQENSNVKDWKWVPSKENPADEGTREGRAKLEDDSRWFKGPGFLKSEEEDWPIEAVAIARDVSEDEGAELRKEFLAVIVEEPVAQFPLFKSLSKYIRIVRAAAYVRKFCGYIMSKRSLLPQLDLKKAELFLFRRSQMESFPKEMKLLAVGKDIPPSSQLYQLSPILDENGCLRMKSRLESAEQEDLRSPIILHQKHYLTRLLMEHYHQKFAHHGEDTIRNELRQRFWIPCLRSTLRKVVRACVICKIRKAKTRPPLMGALPDFRLQPQSRPFKITGMDYFGPMEVTIGRRREKRYGVLFTCLTTRAVHLELAHSLTTDSCVMAIRRMIAARGAPEEIHSDNGTNLRGAEKEMRHALMELDQQSLIDQLQVLQIQWYFIPPSSPHMGGAWERLVRSIKTAMGIILKERSPREEVLWTVMKEAEALVNSRPLTDVPVEPQSQEALTPFHFLIGSSSTAQPPGQFGQEDLDVRKLWRRSQALTEMFWRRWVKEYLPTLQRRAKWHGKPPPIACGEVVVVVDESLRRGSWPLGVITQIFPGKDGIARVAEVKTAGGIYRRPIVKLAKLDVISPESQD